MMEPAAERSITPVVSIPPTEIGPEAGDCTNGPLEPLTRATTKKQFEELYERYSREVWALAYARWLDADSAQDITQEAFLRLWKFLECGETILSPRAWLMRVARNLAEDHAKSSFRRNGTQPPEMLTAVPSMGNGPLERMVQDESFAQIREVLEELPAPDRELLALRYAFDYDAPQIADAFGIAVTAVHMRLSRARQRLADKLTARGIGANG